MKVKELIDVLERYDQELTCYLPDEDGNVVVLDIIKELYDKDWEKVGVIFRRDPFK